MNKKKIVGAGLAFLTLASLVSLPGGKVDAATLGCEAVQEKNVKYVNVSMWDINPERYNAQMRGFASEAYYPQDIAKRAEYDGKSLLFGSTDGMNVGGIQNGYIGANTYRKCDGVIQGLANSKLQNGNLVISSEFNNGDTLFPNHDVEKGWYSSYNEVLKDWKFPFLKQENGYYSFNSEQLHVTRDYNSKKFTLHNGSRNGFYPFNSCQDNTFVNSNKNLFFTAKFEIPFYMNKDGKVKNMKTGQMEDMVFNFSGDDDVWIFVDDNLVVDLGGVHIKQTGDINFANNTVFYSNVYNRNNDTDHYNVTQTALKSGKLSEGKHTLRVFYMERAGGESNLFVNFNLQSSGLKVNHIEKETNKILDSEILTGAVGCEVSTQCKNFAGHRIIEKPQTEKYVLSEDLQTVNYYYDTEKTLNVKYLDVIDGHEVAPEEKQIHFEGEDYSTIQKEIKDYKFVKDSGNTSGKMTNKDLNVAYYYQYSNALARANYIDKTTGERMDVDEKIGLEGEKISFEERQFENYVLVEKPQTNDVILSKKEQEVNYYYKKKGKIIVNYIDKLTGKNLDTVVNDGVEGDKVTTEEKEFDKYRLYQAPEKNTYEITRDEQNVNYYYLYQTNVKVNYIDKDTNEKLDEKNSIETEGIIYHAKEEFFENYKVIEKPESEDFLVGRDDIEINYYYRKLKFNLKIEMNLVQATVNDHFYKLKGKLGKVETEIREANANSKVKIFYNVKISNNQERKGGGKVSVQLPQGYIAMQEDNFNWKVDGDKIELNIDNLDPNQSVEYELVLTKNSQDDICGKIKNCVRVESNGIEETELSDNEDSNELVIMPRTGIKKLYISLLFIISLSIFGVIRFIKKKSK